MKDPSARRNIIFIISTSCESIDGQRGASDFLQSYGMTSLIVTKEYFALCRLVLSVNCIGKEWSGGEGREVKFGSWD